MEQAQRTVHRAVFADLLNLCRAGLGNIVLRGNPLAQLLGGQHRIEIAAGLRRLAIQRLRLCRMSLRRQGTAAPIQPCGIALAGFGHAGNHAVQGLPMFSTQGRTGEPVKMFLRQLRAVGLRV